MQRPKRRWFQFRLRTLLIVMTLFGLWLAHQVNRANRQRRAIQSITDQGGNVYYDYQQVTNATGPQDGAWVTSCIRAVQHGCAAW